MTSRKKKGSFSTTVASLMGVVVLLLATETGAFQTGPVLVLAPSHFQACCKQQRSWIVSPSVPPNVSFNHKERNWRSTKLPLFATNIDRDEEDANRDKDLSVSLVEQEEKAEALNALGVVAVLGSGAFLMTLVGGSGGLELSSLVLPSTPTANEAMATGHVLSFAIWLGTIFYTQFVSGFTMYKNLPQQTFGKIQAKLFPKYFLLCSIAIFFQLFSLQVLGGDSFLPAYHDRAMLTLLVALVGTLVNLLFLEPVTTHVMMERYQLENEPGGMSSDKHGQLMKDFGLYHTLSNVVDFACLCAAVLHGSYLASTLIKGQ